MSLFFIVALPFFGALLPGLMNVRVLNGFYRGDCGMLAFSMDSTVGTAERPLSTAGTAESLLSQCALPPGLLNVCFLNGFWRRDC